MQSQAHIPEKYHIHIQHSKGWVNFNLKEFWQYRELLYFLTWRDIKVRYKQTALGILWAILQPLLTMVVFSFFFGELAKLSSDGLPYPIFSMAGLVPWTLFENSLAHSSTSLINSANLIQKIYFPRLIIPVASVLGGVVDFLLAFAILLVMVLIYGIVPGWRMLWLPLLVLLALTISLGVGLWLAALSVQFRDVRFLVGFLIRIWFFASPVTYSSKMLEEPLHTLYGINPMVGVVDGFRWALLGSGEAPGATIALSVAVSLIILVGGLFYFRRMEKTFADVI